MSDDRKNALDALVSEAKKDLTPRIDDAKWASLEEKLLARMAEPHQAAPTPIFAASSSPSSSARVLRIGAYVLAAAAAVALVAKRDSGPEPTGVGTRADLSAGSAGSLRSTEGSGAVRVAGMPASVGRVLRTGDLVETEGGARAVLERPSKVAWLLERQSSSENAAVARARVKSAGEALILALEDGAIEAQVTPVPSGEAFAVDVTAGSKIVRVAVHGTHLRVARTGSRVVIDLTEGVVSIGVPPRTGTTYGTLVTAPAHVELDAADLDGTIRVDHLPASVRAPVPLSPFASLGSHQPAVAAQAELPAAPAARDVSPPALAPATVPRPPALPRSLDQAGGASPDPVAKVDPAKTGPVVPPREAIAAAVRACAAARNRPENVRVTVTSSLKLKIAASGDVETAQFDPPLLPEIQSCAATAIYKAKIEDAAGTSISVPIAFSY